MTYPYKRHWQKMNWLPREGETWDEFYARTALAIEARRGETQGGSTRSARARAEGNANQQGGGPVAQGVRGKCPT